MTDGSVDERERRYWRTLQFKRIERLTYELGIATCQNDDFSAANLRLLLKDAYDKFRELGGDMKEKEQEERTVTNLADARCRTCGEKYDTPHNKNCPRRRPRVIGGPERVLVKYEDVDTEVLP